MTRKNFKNYYLPFFANLLACLGVAISIGIIYKHYSSIGYVRLSQNTINSIWICNFLSFLLIFLSFYYFVRDVIVKKYHVPRKYFVFVYVGYVLSFLIIVSNIIFGLITFFISAEMSFRKLLLWTCLGIDGGIWIVGNTITWYGFTLIELKYRKKMSDRGHLEQQTKTKHEEPVNGEATASGDLKSFV